MRVSFPDGMQRRFIEHSKSNSGLSWRGFRTALGIANHGHYRYEDCTLPAKVFTKALKVSGISGAQARRYHYRFVRERTEIVLKLRRNIPLAEFVGICLGDGHLSHNYVAIFGDKARDTAYLLGNVAPIMREVFNLTPKFKVNRPDENFLILNSTAAVRSLHAMGLPIGDKIKGRARIPGWIFARNSFIIACVRGLFDTDGCVYGFIRRPPAKGKKAIISFEFGKGSLLTKGVYRALRKLGYSPRMMPHRNECRLAINSDIVSFMKTVRPASRKHWDNFQRWHGPVV